MHIANTDSPRKAVGSIIGGVFLVLIFTSMITSYVFIENSRRSYDKALFQRQEMNNKKALEDLEYISVYKKANNFLNITVSNNGNIGTQIVYVGEINETSAKKEDFYHRINLFLNPMETATDISSNYIRIEENQSKILLLLTSYGNTYFYLYNEKLDNGTGGPDTYYDLTISVSGTGTTSPSVGVHSYQEDTDVDVTAFPGGSWSFSHWELDGVPAGSANPRSVTMDADHDLEAVFTQNPPLILIEDYFDNFDNWEGTNWEIQSDQYYSASTSARSDLNNEHDLQSLRLNTSSAVSLNIVFWYRLTGGIDSNDVAIQLYDGQGGPDIIDYLYGVEDSWTLYNYTTFDSQYFISDFYINFDSNLGGAEMIWIDDLKITLIQ